MSMPDAVVLLGFGGPTKPDEIRPFLDRVLQGRRIPTDRYELVVSHYMHMGGKSPFNERTQQQAQALQAELLARGIRAPVRTAYLNAAPFVDDAALELRGKNVAAIVLAAHQSPASFDKYVGLIPNAAYVQPYYEHPLFVAANAERVREALHRLGEETFDDVALVFTAHSIPQSMADASPYVAQLARSAELVAREAGASSYTVAYQSRSGSPMEKWLEPDVRDALTTLAQSGIRQAIVTPIGFLCDHVEVLYDLDVDAARTAADAGLRMERALALNDHPLFVRMLADLVCECSV